MVSRNAVLLCLPTNNQLNFSIRYDIWYEICAFKCYDSIELCNSKKLTEKMLNEFRYYKNFDWRTRVIKDVKCVM